ncbi:MAG: hypothetical protein J6D79_00705 [Clostridia bacterium]|nr:hypothetical protein [Clostridia bacterium]
MANEKKTKAANYIVGVFVLVFFIIGVASTVSLIAGRVRKASDNGAKLREYESFIYPVVMNDPDTFDDVSKAQQSQLIAISIWSILQSNLDTDKYSYSDKGMLIPKKDVEEAFKRLFGADVKVNHTSADGGGIEFKYSEKKGQYIIPITGITPLYTPSVLNAKEKNDFITLSVGYLSGDDWEQDENGNPVKPEPSKYVKIILRKNGDRGYCVSALRSADAPD